VKLRIKIGSSAFLPFNPLRHLTTCVSPSWTSSMCLRWAEHCAGKLGGHFCLQPDLIADCKIWTELQRNSQEDNPRCSFIKACRLYVETEPTTDSQFFLFVFHAACVTSTALHCSPGYAKKSAFSKKTTTLVSFNTVFFLFRNHARLAFQMMSLVLTCVAITTWRVDRR